MSHCSGPQGEHNGLMEDFLREFREQNPVDRVRSFPDGRLGATDDGACKFGVTVARGKVVLAFDRPMDWVGMTAQQASDLADALNARSLQARGITS